MKFIFPDSVLVECLLRMADNSYHFHLYINNLTPTLATVLGDLTEANSGHGYSVLTVARADFTTTGVTAHLGTIIAAPISWTFSAGGTDVVYGVYVTDTTNAKLIMVAELDTSVNTSAGATVSVVPIFGDEAIFSS